jgi:hypothetical protein
MSLQDKLIRFNHHSKIQVTLTDDQILIFEIDKELDTESINEWVYVVGELITESEIINKRIYDLRNIVHFPLAALKAAIKLRQSPNVHLHFVVVLVGNKNVHRLIELILRIQPGGRTRVMRDKEEAIKWLNEQGKSPLL